MHISNGVVPAIARMHYHRDHRIVSYAKLTTGKINPKKFYLVFFFGWKFIMWRGLEVNRNLRFVKGNAFSRHDITACFEVPR